MPSRPPHNQKYHFFINTHYHSQFLLFYSNEATHDILKQALTACTCMEHRGASSADNISGDGAGIVHIMILRQTLYKCMLHTSFAHMSINTYKNIYKQNCHRSMM
jgi:glutamate synthase domain-containing protein 1